MLLESKAVMDQMEALALMAGMERMFLSTLVVKRGCSFSMEQMEPMARTQTMDPMHTLVLIAKVMAMSMEQMVVTVAMVALVEMEAEVETLLSITLI